MVDRKTSAGRRPKITLAFGVCASLAACASGSIVQTNKPNFTGAWSAKWCDPEHPQAECGNFVLHLVQQGERICGQHFVATPRMSKLEEGEPGSVLGTAVGNKAVLLINNARSGERNIAVVSLTPHTLQWHVVGVAIQGEKPWDSIIGGEWILSADISDGALAALRALKEHPCRWPDELSSEEP